MSREFVPNVNETLYQNLLKLKLKHKPVNYRIQDLSKLSSNEGENEEEEEEKEQYGFNAISPDEHRPRRLTQPKLSFPLT